MYKIAQLILTPGQHDSTCEVYVSQPDAHKEALAGKLFALIKIDSTGSDNLKIVNFLVNTINYHYYQNEKMILRERLSNIKIEHIFESAMAKTNKKLSEFLQNEKVKLNPASVNILIGVIYKNAIHFTSIGKNRALLVYRNKNDKDQFEYKLADVAAQAESQDGKKHHSLTKLFSNIVSGSLPPQGYFFITDEGLPEYLSDKQLINIITTLPPSSAVEQIKNTLLKINSFVPFMGIIIKNTDGQPEVEPKNKIVRPVIEPLAENINVTEEKTEKLLSPSGIINFKKITSAIDKIKPKKELSGKNLILRNEIVSKKKPIFIKTKKIFSSLMNIFLYFINAVVSLLKILTDKDKIKRSFTGAKSALENAWVKTISGFSSAVSGLKSLSRKNKILIAFSVFCLLFLAQNLLWSNAKNIKIEKQKIHDSNIGIIEQKQNQIDANLLYNNEDGAKKLMGEVNQLLTDLPKLTTEDKKLYQQLDDKRIAQLEKIRHVIKVTAPAEIANFSSLDAKANPTNLVLAGGKIYAADAQEKTIYQYDIDKKYISAISNFKKPINTLNFPATDKSNNIFYLNKSEIIKLSSKSDKITELTLKYNGDPGKITDMISFNNKLYALVPSENQVYRLNLSQTTAGEPSAWMKDHLDLTDANGLGVDGSIYLLNKTGVLKFLKGLKQNFSLSPVEPVMSQASKLLISQDQKFIYILEPINKRLLVYDKSGNFISQYIVDRFNRLKDFIVDEKAKKLYFLNNTSVYSVDGQHFDKQ